jgi:hypothetical protein
MYSKALKKMTSGSTKHEIHTIRLATIYYLNIIISYNQTSFTSSSMGP